MSRICLASILSFSKLTSPLTCDSLPSNKKVRSFFMMGKNGMSGGGVLRWSSRYLAMLWKGFMKPDMSCDYKDK